MISLSNAVPVNTSADDVQLDWDDVWRGLLWKAENPMPFVPSITRCEVVERTRDGFLREILDFGEPIRELVTVEPKRRITFERLTGRIVGTIVNEIEKDANGHVSLRFTFALEIKGAEPDGPEEKEVRTKMGAGYLNAVHTTLAAVRRFKTDGTPPVPGGGRER